MREQDSDQETLSALDIRDASALLGVPMQGYSVNLEILKRFFRNGGIPVIAHLTKPSGHFVVIIAFYSGYVLLGDPSWGRRVIRDADLATEHGMSGVILVGLPTESQRVTLENARSQENQWLMERIGELENVREWLR